MLGRLQSIRFEDEGWKEGSQLHPEKKSSVSSMPYHLERYKDKAIVVNTKTGKHHSLSPIPIQNAKAQMRVLEAAAKKEGKK